MSTDGHLKYRADIDGLRAIAVLSVVAFHAFPAFVPGGYVGVDVFFVISGFLISSTIFAQLEAGRFRYSDFLSRRVRRIFPALTLVLGSCLAAGWVALTPDELRQLGEHVAGGAGFVSNFVLKKEAGYFDLAAELKPLLHLWSLGIEEQFYLFFPLFLVIVYKLRWRPLPCVAAVLLASFALNVARVRADPVRAFYLPESRFWELMIGGALAWLQLRRQQGVAGRWKELAAWVGLAALLAGPCLLTKKSLFPGWWALLPTLGSAAVIASPGALVNRRVLSLPLLQWFGRISYPLYLWHWPLLSFALVLGVDEVSAPVKGGLVLLAVLLSYATYRFWETPLRFGGSNRTRVASLCAGLATVGAAGYLMKVERGFLTRFPPEMRRLLDVPETAADEWRRHSCFLGPEDFRAGFAAECAPPGAIDLFLWGDSHASALYPGLAAWARDHGMTVAQFTMGGCPPILEGLKDVDALCDGMNRDVLARVAKLRPRVVILGGHWRLYADYPRVASTLAALRELGVKVVLLGPAPDWKAYLPKLLWNHWKRHGHEMPPEFLAESLHPDTPAVDRALGELAGQSGARYLSPFAALCDPRGCRTRIGDSITSVDADHLSPAAARFVVESGAALLAR